jgi:hypothetical protein
MYESPQLSELVLTNHQLQVSPLVLIRGSCQNPLAEMITCWMSRYIIGTTFFFFCFFVIRSSWGSDIFVYGPQEKDNTAVVTIPRAE